MCACSAAQSLCRSDSINLSLNIKDLYLLMRKQVEDRQVYAYDSCVDRMVPLSHLREDEEAYALLQKVKDPTKSPYDCIGLLAFKAGGVWHVGTAFQTGPRTLLTAAHNCCLAPNGPDYSDWRYYPRAQGDVSVTSGGIPIVGVDYPQQYKATEKRMDRVEHDYAMLILAQDNVC